MQIEIVPIAMQTKYYCTDYKFLNHSIVLNITFITNVTYTQESTV